ncbi:MAG: ABC transporter substrate-binding protein [bacterium]|nr:ABC transporter substrate-binding protein [bacterium]
MTLVKIGTTFAVALVLVLTATGLWAAGAEEEPAAAADKRYVTDPTTGKVVVAPQYGGTITIGRGDEPDGPDAVVSGPWATAYVSGVAEKLGIADWATPRDKFDFQFLNVPTNTIGALAESWSQPDPLTYVVNVRQGVRWHDKPPMNGRELTAQDVEFNYHRITGMGSGFTEPSEFIANLNLPFESITATDDSTVVFTLKELNLGAIGGILDGAIAWIYPPEVIREHGDVTEWRSLVGTGPIMLTDWVEGSSVTWDKNPDYWGHDEKFPENRLPYVDQLKILFVPEVATRLAALRTGRIDFIGPYQGSAISTLEQVENLERTDPELVIHPITTRSNNAIGINVQLSPFDDISVRKALQMAINLEEINRAFYGGRSDMTPQGSLNRSFSEIVTQFEDWPEDVKKVFDYDPEGAEALLDEAGYPRGADGIRFKTELLWYVYRPLSYAELLTSYWKRIGVDVEIDVAEGASGVARRNDRDFEMIAAEAAIKWDPIVAVGRHTPPQGWNTSNVDDQWYTATVEAARAATTLEEQHRMVGELNQYGIEKFWSIWGGIAPTYAVAQPWLIGFNGELELGWAQANSVFTRLWIDQDLKQEMGH